MTILKDNGWDTYIDWKDSGMPEIPDAETADRIQNKIVALDYFLFLATPNSVASRWCPWEIGFADGRKSRSSILIVPTTEGGSTYGNEYLQIYPRIDEKTSGGFEVFKPGHSFFSTPLKTFSS